MKHWLALAALLLAPGTAAAISQDDIRPFEEVFAISATAQGREQVTVRWDIAPDHYLYNNKYLSFESATPGVELGPPVIPEGERKFDPLLGEEVVKYHGRLEVRLPLVFLDAGVEQVDLNVRSQGCLEAVLCYPPTAQQVSVALSTAPNQDAGLAAVMGTDPLSNLGRAADPLAVMGQDTLGRDPALQPDDAFRYEAIGLSSETALVRFTAAPGYYLYIDKFRFRTVDAPGFEVREVNLPEGVIKDDPEFGPVPVVYGQVEIPVRLNRPAGPEQALTLEADYQGCRDGDICYPPQITRVTLLMAASERAIAEPVVSSANVVPAPVISEQSRLAQLLLENPDGALLAFFVAGLLLAFTPCVFPMVPILSGIIAGEGDSLTTLRAFWLSLVYVLAMAVTYTVAGVLAGLFGQNLQAVFQNPWIISGFVLIFVALALSMFGFYELQLPSRWQTALTEQSNRQQGGKLGGVAVMGFLSALIVGPCVAPPLAAALIVIGSSGSPTLGGSALFSMSLGMGVPLIAFGVSAGKLIPRAGMWMSAVKAVFGVGLLALAIWMLERILPGSIIMVLWGLLAITCGVFLRALDRLPDDASGWRRLWKALGIALLLLGAIQLFGAASGGDYWLKPLGHLRFAGGESRIEHVEFRPIKSVDDLWGAIDQANASGKPAMLDFYADWCVECIRMERNTFPDSSVQALLERMQPLQADVTGHDEVDQALMAEFGIIGPPAILFFDLQGQEMTEYRLVGYFKPETFSLHLRRVLDAQ